MSQYDRLQDNLPCIYSRASDSDVLRAYLGALGEALDHTEAAEVLARAQLIITGAGGAWVDFWGLYFGVARATGEADAAYAQRIIDEVFRQRNTVRAIENNIVHYTGDTVEIYEPWRNMFRLSVSRLSHVDRLPGGFYAYHIIQPVARGAVDWTETLAVIDADRPAGTLVADWRHRYDPRLVVLTGDPEVGSVYSRLIPRGVARLYRLSVDHVLSDTLPIRQPASLVGRWVASGVDLTGILTDALHRAGGTDRVQFATVFVDLTPNWSGAWDEDTWGERAAGIPIPLYDCQHVTGPYGILDGQETGDDTVAASVAHES